MSLNQGSLGMENSPEDSGAPFSDTSAHNGTSIDADGKVVLGNDLNDGVDAAQLLSSRQILLNGNTMRWTQGNIGESNFLAPAHEIEGTICLQRMIATFGGAAPINCDAINDSFGIFIGIITPR